MIKTTTTHISTAMGTTSQWHSAGLSEHAVNLNEIGYTGKYKGTKMSRNEYLRQYVNTDKVTFTIDLTKYDNGDFCEGYLLTKAELISEPKDTISVFHNGNHVQAKLTDTHINHELNGITYALCVSFLLISIH